MSSFRAIGARTSEGAEEGELDEAVAPAYGWPADLAEDEMLKRLLDLNLARAAANPSP